MFLAHILLKFVAVGSEKYVEEKDGFDGFGVSTEVIKSRTNQAGQSCMLIYDKLRGVDELRTSVRYAKDNDLVSGNRNAMYFIDNKDVKFSLNNIHKSFSEKPELYDIMNNTLCPYLERRLSTLTRDEIENNDINVEE